MYWNAAEFSPVPKGWLPTSLSAQLAPFQFEETRPLSEEESAYCQYYGLNLSLTRPDLIHRIGYLDAGGYRIAMHYYRRTGSGRGTVFVLHGYFDHAGLYSRLFAHLVDQGFSVICLELPGHGLSSGDAVSIRRFEEYGKVLADCLKQCESRVPTPWHAVGQSTGAAVLTQFLLLSDEPDPFKHVVYLAPLVRSHQWRRVLLMHRILSPFFRRWKRGFIENSSHAPFIRFIREHDPFQARELAVDWVTALKIWVDRVAAAEPRPRSIKIIQGERDTTVDWRYNLDILQEKFQLVKVHRIPLGRHHLVNESPELLKEIYESVSEAISRR